MTRWWTVAALWLVFCLWLANGALAQTVQNPRVLRFESPDHATVTGHEIDIVRVSDTVVIQTLTVLRADTRVEGADVLVDVNVQPVAFGSYQFRARARAGTLVSATSDPSPTWERAPGKPTNLRPGGDE